MEAPFARPVLGVALHGTCQRKAGPQRTKVPHSGTALCRPPWDGAAAPRNITGVTTFTLRARAPRRYCAATGRILTWPFSSRRCCPRRSWQALPPPLWRNGM